MKYYAEFFVRYVLLLAFLGSFVSCQKNSEKEEDVFCRIENVERFYDGMTFNINMSLDKDCYDVDLLNSGMRVFTPVWIETVDDTLLLKEFSPWANMVSDSCLKAGCPQKTPLSFGRMKRTNLRKSNYKWFVEWVDSSMTKGEYLFPKGTKMEPFYKFSQKCLKVVIPCFGKDDPPNMEYNISVRENNGVTCSYCEN